MSCLLSVASCMLSLIFELRYLVLLYEKLVGCKRSICAQSCFKGWYLVSSVMSGYQREEVARRDARRAKIQVKRYSFVPLMLPSSVLVPTYLQEISFNINRVQRSPSFIVLSFMLKFLKFQYKILRLKPRNQV